MTMFGRRNAPSHRTTSGTSILTLCSWGSVLLAVCLVKIVSGAAEPPPPPPEEPEKEIQISYKFVNKTTAILSCIIKDLGKRRVIWTKLSDPYPIAVGRYMFHPNKKYRVRNRVNTNMLTISNVGLQDAGEYECRVSGAYPIKAVASFNMTAGRETAFFLHGNRTVPATVGMEVELPCNVDNLNDRMVLWKDNRNNVVSLRKRVYNGDKRMSVLHRTRPEWSLKIDTVKPDDFGYYTCMINSNPVLTRTIELINDEPPHLAPVIKKDTNFQSKLEVMEGETVTLTCNFHSYPPATVKWYKRYRENGKSKRKYLGAEGNMYTLRSVQLEQSGDYVCIGRNGMDKDGRARTRLTVKAIPTTVPTTMATTTFVPTGPVAPRLYHEQKRTGQKRGFNAALTCFAIGQPRPKIHWERHGKKVINDHKYRINNDARGRFTLHSTLTIRSVGSRDFGSYECVAFNSYGRHEMFVELFEDKS